MKDAAGERAENEMTWLDAVDPATKDVVEIGACDREEIVQ
jgi:hypothetical protein